MSYQVEYLPSAIQDLRDIVFYISHELSNPASAESLAEEIVAKIDKSVVFPYAYPAYRPIRPLEHEYRRMAVKNYLVFYWVEEEKQLVTVARVVYGRRNHSKIL